jgi:hypothetical protein
LRYIFVTRQWAVSVFAPADAAAATQPGANFFQPVVSQRIVNSPL